jgi:peptide deformylase
MTKQNLHIYLHPDPILRKNCQDVKNISLSETQELVDSMILTMQTANGIGLAAPQIGRSINLLVINDGRGDQIFINPKIIYKSRKKNIFEEGCLSIPGVYGNVTRPATIWLIYKDRFGKLRFKKATALEARILQHEVDHIHGILFIDRTDDITQGKELLAEYENQATRQTN